MAKKIAKKLNVTRVSFCTVAVNDGEPSFVSHPDAVFNGMLDQAKAEKLLKARLGKDELVVITKLDASQHRFEMDLETFVLNAVIADDASGDDDDGDEDETIDTETGGEEDPAPIDPSDEPPAAVPEAPVAPAQPEEPESTDLPLE